MANINPLDPSTFSVSKTDFAGKYYYTVAVIPSDPQAYQGPPYFTITTSTLLHEETILDMADAMRFSRKGKSQTDMQLDFELVDATINKELV